MTDERREELFKKVENVEARLKMFSEMAPRQVRGFIQNSFDGLTLNHVEDWVLQSETMIADFIDTFETELLNLCNLKEEIEQEVKETIRKKGMG